jgi:hypothetical protein
MATTTAFSTTNASSILKTLYLPPIREMLDNATVLLKYLEKEVQEVEGKSFTIPLHVSRNQIAGVGVAENAAIPTAGSQGYTTAVVPSKYLYSRIAVTGQAIAASKSNKGSFLRVLDAEMKGVTKDTLRSFNRQLHGDGRDVLGFWVSGTGTAPIVDDGLGNSGYDFFQAGTTTCDLVKGSDNATNWYSAFSALRTSTLGATGRTLTTGVSMTNAVATDYFVQAGTLGNQMTGIQAVISKADPVLLSGGLHGLTVAAQPDWAAQWLSADGGTTEPTTSATRRDLSFPLMQQIFSAIATNSDFSEADIKLLLCSYQMRDTYVKLCQDERKFYNTMKLDGGFEAVSYNGKPLVPDVHCRHNRIYFITPESMALFRLQEMDWMDRDGSSFYRMGSGDNDAYGATLFVYQELGCRVRNANGVLVGVSENF